MMTIKKFNKFPAWKVFGTGVLDNSPEGLYMTAAGGSLRWVAVKVDVNDWAIYCHWSGYDVKWVMANGDKVMMENHIKRCVPCDDEVFARYRY